MKNTNQINIPEAREAMDKFKMEAANEVGVNLKQGYNGHLTSREAVSDILCRTLQEKTCQKIVIPPHAGRDATSASAT